MPLGSSGLGFIGTIENDVEGALSSGTAAAATSAAGSVGTLGAGLTTELAGAISPTNAPVVLSLSKTEIAIGVIVVVLLLIGLAIKHK